MLSKKILIADDEANIVISLEFLMLNRGYQVRTAANGEEALHQIAEFRPDLILLDVQQTEQGIQQEGDVVGDERRLVGQRMDVAVQGLDPRAQILADVDLRGQFQEAEQPAQADQALARLGGEELITPDQPEHVLDRAGR